MSLLNQVLQELDARGGSRPPAASSPEVKLAQSVAPSAKPRPWGRLIFCFLLLGIIGLAASRLTHFNPAPSSLPLPPVAAVATLPVKPSPPPANAVTLAPPLVQGLKLTETLLSTPQTSLSSASTPARAPAAHSGLELHAASQLADKAQANLAVLPSATAELPSPVSRVPASASGTMQIQPVKQGAETEYRRASQLLQQGRQPDALQALELALKQEPGHHAARQLLVTQLLSLQRQDEAIAHLQQGLAQDLTQVTLAFMLARLQVERQETSTAITTLQHSLPYATSQPDYHALLAALLQRQGQHPQAVQHYQIALQLRPAQAVWWMGLGISLQAQERRQAALEAFQKARAGQGLSPQLLAFVEQKIGQLQ